MSIVKRLVLSAILILFFAYLVQYSKKVIYVTGLFTVNRHNHQPGPCRIIAGIEYGSEDIHMLSNGVALVSAGMNADITDIPHIYRGIYKFDFNNPDQNLTKLTVIGGTLQKEDFVPHGISLWTDADSGDVTVFTVNHGKTYHGNESVEVFKYDESTLSLHHIETIRDSNFRRLNDLVATSKDTFYATNDDIWFSAHTKWRLEPFLQTRFGNVVYYDGQNARIVASGFVLPNGINLSQDERTLYVMLYGEAKMVVFQRQTDNTLTETKRVDLHMSRPDNIDIDTDGNMWIAGGYRLLADDSTRPPSSMVLCGKETNGEFTFKEVFVDNGAILGGASVASFYDNQMLIGTPFGRLMYCEVRAL